MITSLKRKLNAKNLELEKSRDTIDSLKKEMEQATLKTVSKESPAAPVYVEGLKKEYTDLTAENKALKQQISQLKNQVEQSKGEILKLQGVIRQYRKIVKEIEVGEATSRNNINHQSNSVLSAISESEANPDEIGSTVTAKTAKKNATQTVTDNKAKFAAIQSLIDGIRKAPSFARAVSLCIK